MINSRDLRFSKWESVRSISCMATISTHSSPLRVAERVVADGFATHQHALDSLVDNARTRHVSDVLLEVVSDDHEPRPVRERALGRIVVELSRAA